MSHIKSALLLLALLAVSACANPGRFGDDTNTVDLNQTNTRSGGAGNQHAGLFRQYNR